MSRIQQRFDDLKAAQKKALIPYITAGDSNPKITVPLMHTLVEAGADIIEVGVPFSDPMADGPVIQAACERALEHQVSLSDVLDMVKTFRETNDHTPVVLMGYLNPIEVMGYESFVNAAQAAGVDGVLTVDMPPEESEEWVALLREHALDPIFLLAPTSNEERVRLICEAGSGFVYYVSLKGVTGASTLNITSVSEKLNFIRRFTAMPLGVGFGIKDAETAAQMAQVADAVVVGSAIVRLIEQYADDAEAMRQHIAERVSEMRAAIDAA